MVLAAAAEDTAVGRDDPHDFVDVLAVDELTRETDPAQPFVGQHLHASDLYESNLQASGRNACGQNPYD